VKTSNPTVSREFGDVLKSADGLRGLGCTSEGRAWKVLTASRTTCYKVSECIFTKNAFSKQRFKRRTFVLKEPEGDVVMELN
jgi:hypothetical protein